MSLKYNKNLIPRAKELRHNATPQENHLWYDFLSTYPIRFQRQKTIGSFIADFYCHRAKLVIEIDGSQHYTDDGLAYDRERSDALSDFGLRVIRFSNIDVDKNFYEVCKLIDEIVQADIKNRIYTPSILEKKLSSLLMVKFWREQYQQVK